MGYSGYMVSHDVFPRILANNKITRISGDVFVGLKSLRYL